MTIERFWALVEGVHASAPNDMEAKCQRLEHELRLLPLEDLVCFGRHFGDLYSRAYTWDIWGAAFIICKGCSDDSFMDFRSTLISLGRKPYQAALIDADSLVDFDINPEWARYEGYQYVPDRVYKQRDGLLSPDHKSEPVHRREPIGVVFKEWEMSLRFPRLVAKYGYKDLDWLYLKLQQEKDESDHTAGERLALFLLNSETIHANGLIPPPKVVADLVRTGAAQGGLTAPDGKLYQWDERHYWIAVSYLENLSVSDLGSRPYLQTTRMVLDVGSSNAGNYDDWMRSLKERRLA